MDYEQKLKSLREKYPDEESSSWLDGMADKLKIASLTANLKNHDGMKLILAGMERELQSIRTNLLTNEALFKDQEGILLGRVLHERRKWIESFMAVFTRANAHIESLTNVIDTKLTE